MCLVVFAWRCHPDYRLVVAANRDEQHARPAADMDWWPDQPDLLAGRDLQAGGTWLAVSRSGRFATVTNFRERFRPARSERSRGELVSNFVSGQAVPLEYSAALDGSKYAGFSLLTADADNLCYTSNRDDVTTNLAPGIYGLSNASLDTPWPKLVRTRDALRALMERNTVNPEALMRLLADSTPASVKELDETLPVELARAVSAPFIKTERYGTRCTSVALIGNDDRAYVAERRFDEQGRQTGEQQFRFELTGSAVHGQ